MLLDLEAMPLYAQIKACRTASVLVTSVCSFPGFEIVLDLLVCLCVCLSVCTGWSSRFGFDEFHVAQARDSINPALAVELVRRSLLCPALCLYTLATGSQRAVIDAFRQQAEVAKASYIEWTVTKLENTLFHWH